MYNFFCFPRLSRSKIIYSLNFHNYAGVIIHNSKNNCFFREKKNVSSWHKVEFHSSQASLPKTKFHVQLSLLCWCWHPEWRTLPHQCYLAADIFFSRTFPHPQGGWIIYCGNLVSYAGRGFDMGGWESVRRSKSPQHPSFKQIKQLNSVQTNQHMPGTLVSLHTL